MTDQTNIKAFNQGYKLAQLDKYLANSLSGSINKQSSESMRYFQAGVNQFQKDIEREKLTERKISREKGIDR